MAEMDQGIKRLVQSHPQDLLGLALPGAEYIEALPVDVATEPQLVLDTLLRVRYQGVVCAVDLEAEATPRDRIAQRLHEYGARAMFVTQLPVISVVFWLEPGGRPPPSPYQVWVGDRHITDWHFIVIPLYDLPAQTLLEHGLPGLLPLIPFTHGGAELEVIERTAAMVRQQAPAGEVDILESLLFVFAARSFDASVLLAMMRRLHMSTEIIEKSAFYQEAIARGLAQGLQQGIEQGKIQGRSEGKAEGLRDAIQVVLRARFGEPATDLLQGLAAAPADTLQDLLERASTESLEQVRAHLGL